MIAHNNPQQAWDFMQNNPNAVLLDVRTKVEYDFVGHPINAIHIPWQEAPNWQVNANFAGQTKIVIDNIHTPVLLICRSGQRSMKAAKQLKQEGYLQLINVEEGFEGALDKNKHRGNSGGWRFRNLPWEQG